MRWMTTCLLVLSLLGIAKHSRAEDPLLRTIDILVREGRCVEALALLGRADASPASRSGRRALCESQAGHHEDAATLIADAFRSPTDPWVIEHREVLLAALRLSTTEAEVIPAPPANGRTEAVFETVAANPYYYSSVERVLRVRTAPRLPVPAAYADATVVNPYYLHE